jgi:two-component system CheB/CheR fusion protein
LFHDHLRHALAQARRKKLRVALLFIDLDNFKTINDTLGHDVGDELLKLAATRMNLFSSVEPCKNCCKLNAGAG